MIMFLKRLHWNKTQPPVLVYSPGKVGSSTVRQTLEKELNRFFGIDLNAITYDRQKGYSIIHHHEADFLIMRMEDLDRSFKKALCDFLAIDGISFEVVNSNITGQKKFAAEYKLIRENLQPPAAYLDRYHSTGYYQHFYRPDD